MIAGGGGLLLSRFARLFVQLLGRVAVSLLVVAFVSYVSAPTLSAASSLEYEVKAAYLLNFTKFVEWPPAAFPSADAPLTICLLGNDPFGRVIDQIIGGESVNGHKVAVERVRTDQSKSCHVVYVGNNGTMPATFTAPGSAVLTVGEGDDFIHQGGVIAFVVDDRHVRFDISLKAATNAGLKLSSKLLSVARSVER
jgi:hypothetical protein